MPSDKENDESMLNYIIILKNGNGIPLNKIETAENQKISSDKGNDKVINNYGDIIDVGN